MAFQKESRVYKTFLISTCLAAALCLSGVFLGISFRTSSLIHDELLSRARAQFDGIVLAREWNSSFGGVYVEKKGGVTSSPYLKNPDITATDHKVYTKKSPAQMTHEMSEISQKHGKFLFHVTSLKPLNPENAPDAFEQKTLKLFESGLKERFAIENRGERSYYRYMAPLYVTKECLLCHEHQGYKIGEVRGGISVFFDIEDLQRKLRTNNQLILLFGITTAVLLLSVIWHLTSRLIKKLSEARREIEELATTDGLTRLSNRRHVIERFQEEFERGKRLGENLGCIMFDVDHFKRVNDEHGHQTGDEVLKKIAQITSNCIRTYDIVGRFGGEEFIIVLPESDYPNSKNFAERLRNLVRQESFQAVDGAAAINVTISLGVTVLRSEDTSVDDLIKRADEALYQAKGAGRDRVGSMEE